MSSQLEEMREFFDARIDGYDEHMLGMFEDFKLYYATLANAIAPTRDTIHILDLGCGTGAELDPIFERAPNAIVTGIDMSMQMLDMLREKYKAKTQQLKLIQGSYLSLPLGQDEYDYVVSVYTMHHFTTAVKVGLYQKIHACLKQSGLYIEGDCVVTQEKEQEVWDWYTDNHPEGLKSTLRGETGTLYHIDIPCTIPTQMRLFREAGFRKAELVWHRQTEESTIFVVTP